MPTHSDILSNIKIRPNGHDVVIIRQNFAEIAELFKALAAVTESADSDDLELMDWLGM